MLQLLAYIAIGLLVCSDLTKADVDSYEDNGRKIISVTGTINLGDERKLRASLVQAKDGIVSLKGPGGRVPAAIDMGKVIRFMELPTVIGENDVCASACALAWLGGSPRYAYATAHIGFHGAYTVDKNGKAETDPAANALVGAYLHGLGLPEEAIALITTGKPDEITWLSPKDASEHGINLVILEPKPPEPPKPAEIDAVVRNVIRTWMVANTSNDPESLLKLYSIDDEEISASIARQWRAVIKDWPWRRYSLHDGKFVKGNCEDFQVECRFSMLVDFSVENQKEEKLEGTVKVTLSIKQDGNSIFITHSDVKPYSSSASNRSLR